MREIKFRAYDLLESNLGMGVVDIYESRRVHIIFDSGETPSYKEKDTSIPKWRHNSINMKHCIVMQYTGLLDKQGVEIYEGDIVKLGKQHWYPGCGHGEIGQVIWTGYQYAMEGYKFSLLLIATNSVEVIGNIYENSELLND